MLSYQVVLNSPFMTCEQYSRFSGIPRQTIANWIADGRIPVKSCKRSRDIPLINMVALLEIATQEAIETQM